MSDDPAVQAIADVGLTHGGAYTMPPRPQCRCGFNTVTFAGLREHIAAAYVEALRPIIEAEVRAEIADEIRVLVRLRDAVIEQCIDDYMAEHGLTSVRAAVRTEPEQ